MKKNKNEKWFLGLDIGTDSVGWAVTNESYMIQKHKNNAMWGVMLFDAANQSSVRRGARIARRRLDRRQQRIIMLQELFAKEISKIDETFFIRLKESSLFSEDKSVATTDILFDGKLSNCKNFYKQYPTIHHLINNLMESKESHDVRLVYFVCAYMLAHRGHFLIDVDKRNIDAVTDFIVVYSQLMDWFTSVEMNYPWECNVVDFEEIMKKKLSVTAKEKAFKKLLWDGKKQEVSDEAVISAEAIIALLSGKKVNLSDLFNNSEYKGIEIDSVSMGTADFDDILATLSTILDESETELLARVKAVYDWSLLTEILRGEKYISKAKCLVYEQHKEDLTFLKYIIKEYLPQKYKEVFCEANDKANYTSYSYNIKSVKGEIASKYKKQNQEEFCKYIKGIVGSLDVKQGDKAKYDDMILRLELKTFCPKQINSDNRVIPYQLLWVELKIVLDNASNYLKFLNESDEYGSVKDKILSLMEFRIPYYVGPLVDKSKSKNAWMVRKHEGKIYPWNFDDMVDKDKSEAEFIRRMTCKCTYYAGKDVLPQNSLLYSKYRVLNEINNIKINDIKISVECKQRIYEELFMTYRKVSNSRLKDFLLSNNYMENSDVLSGIDMTIKSDLHSYHDFKRLISSRILSEADVEKIIERITFTTDRVRLKSWLSNTYTKLNDEDCKYISKLKYSDFGRLSAEFLTEVCDVDVALGEAIHPNIISMLWQTNENMMQLLSDKYNYSNVLKKLNDKYYGQNPMNISERLDEMYISNAVKRPIYRTLDIVKELHGIMSYPPSKIFVEMARGDEEKSKKKRKDSRREQIKKLYDNIKFEDLSELVSKLETKSDSDLRSEKLFLYFMQLGRCMYTGQALDIEKIGTREYDIDHIYPQSKIKDDSIDNKVFVLSEINGKKKDIYPLNEEIRNKMHGFWEKLYSNGLISDTKRKRLERNMEFTNDELAGFINRQLVETRQSTKALAMLLGEIYPQTEIVYVKAGLISEFRKEYDMLKCREVNDFHHAKDAYLNIVLGNVYNVKFTKNPINFIEKGEQYSMKLKSLLEHDISRGSVVAWIGNGKTLADIKTVMQKNNIRFVRYSKCQKGEFFDINPLKKGKGQIALKKICVNDIKKYGGYNKATIAYFCLIKAKKNGKGIVSLAPVELYKANEIRTVEDIEKYFEEIMNLTNVKVLLNGRKIKINTLMEIDGFRVHLSCRSSMDVWFKGAMQLAVPYKWEKYIKRINLFSKKNIEACNMKKEKLAVTSFDNLSVDENLELYDIFLRKFQTTKYNVLMPTPLDVMEKQAEYFSKLTLEEQVLALKNIVTLFGCNTSAGKDLTLIRGAKTSGILKMTMALNTKRFTSIYIIDQSSTGLFEKHTTNLLEL